MSDLPAEPDVAHAIEIVAMQILTNQVEAVYEMWDSYPEIGEHDWALIVDRITALAKNYEVSRADYFAAYELLESRAVSS